MEDMENDDKEIMKERVAKNVGWVYHDLKWLSKKEAKQANNKRDALLRSLSNKVRFSFAQTKIHIGSLSPGCAICGGGYWQCLFINVLCTACCFYCVQNREIKKESLPKIKMGVEFSNPKNYINFLKRFNFKGVGFSGGEPFLVFNRLLSYIRDIRGKLGKNIYLWVYTNGDLVTEVKLRKLKKIGLNEIRFDICARNYDLRSVELACNIFDTVTVEIPVIPEDYEVVKRCMIKMQQIGVKHLNLHQLFASKFNYKNFIKRRYTLLHSPSFAVSESEIAALKLMSFALNKKLKLQINYCSCDYKSKFQTMGDRRWMAPLIKKDFEELTDANIIRRLSIQSSPTNINNITTTLNKNKCDRNLWSLDNMGTEIHIHSSLLQFINFNKCSLTVSYFIADLSTSVGPEDTAIKVNLYSKNKTFIKIKLILQRKIVNPATIESFIKLFIKDSDEREVLHNLYKNHNLTLNEWRREVELLLTFKVQEEIQADLPEIY